MALKLIRRNKWFNPHDNYKGKMNLWVKKAWESIQSQAWDWAVAKKNHRWVDCEYLKLDEECPPVQSNKELLLLEG